MNCNGHEKQPVAARSKALMLEFCTGTMGTKLYVSLITKDLKLEIYFLSKHLPCFWSRASSCGCFGDKWIIGATRRKPQQWRVCDAVIFLSWRLSRLDWITARQTRPSVRPATFSTKALMCVMSSCNWCMQMSVGGQFAQLSNWVTMVIGGVCHFFDSLVGLPDKGFYFSLCNVVKTATHWPSPRGLFTLLSSPHHPVGLHVHTQLTYLSNNTHPSLDDFNVFDLDVKNNQNCSKMNWFQLLNAITLLCLFVCCDPVRVNWTSARLNNTK